MVERPTRRETNKPYEWNYLTTLLAVDTIVSPSRLECIYQRDVHFNSPDGLVNWIAVTFDEATITSFKGGLKDKSGNDISVGYFFKNGKPDVYTFTKRRGNVILEHFESTDWVDQKINVFTSDMTPTFQQLEGAEHKGYLGYPTGKKLNGIEEAFSEILESAGKAQENQLKALILNKAESLLSNRDRLNQWSQRMSPDYTISTEIVKNWVNRPFPQEVGQNAFISSDFIPAIGKGQPKAIAMELYMPVEGVEGASSTVYALQVLQNGEWRIEADSDEGYKAWKPTIVDFKMFDACLTKALEIKSTQDKYIKDSIN